MGPEMCIRDSSTSTRSTADTTSDTTSEQPIDETTIECPTDLPLVRIVRTFDAPPAKVCRAHTDPDLLLQWNGPRDTTPRIGHFDLSLVHIYGCRRPV